jgi:hypothetical protein
MYMMNHKVDDAIAIFRALGGSKNPEVSMRSNQALSQAETFKQASQNFEARLDNRTAQDAPTRVPPDREEEQAVAVPVHVLSAPVHFLKGKLVSVDCSATPQALLTVAAGAKSVKLHIRDSAHVTLLGADTFSCSGAKKRRSQLPRTSDGDGDVVSVEIQ